MGRPLSRQAVAAGLTAVAVLALGVLAAPQAAATTTTSCANAMMHGEGPQINFLNCSGFADDGAPYVFHVVDFLDWSLPPLPSFNFANVTESCASIQVTSTGFSSSTCQTVA